tara:strand:+ start:1134 stop:1658 length:525 start_codon:yes stop_codon:yes gene_type:complete
MKTLKIMEELMTLFEQEEDVDIAEVETTEEAPSPGVQSMAELIAAAFAFMPTDEEASDIEELELKEIGTHTNAPQTEEPNPRSLIKSVVVRLPVALRAVYTRGPGLGGITPESELYLAQILADAFRYKPTTQEAHIASTVNDEFNDTDPMKVIETIERLLQFTDEPLEDELLEN